MALPIHSKILNKLAREQLKPIGVVRNGQSRTWLDDHGWWVIVIEFQPSGWSKGSYLNVGINWQWYAQDHMSFDLGYREADLVEFSDEEQFAKEAYELVNSAKNRVLEIREGLSTPQSIKSYVLDNTKGDEKNIWACLHRGLACLVTGDSELTDRYLNMAVNCPDDRKWAVDVKQYAGKILSLTSTEDRLSIVKEAIQESRQRKKLKEIEIILPELAEQK
jgi:hypothetical protein